MTIRRDLQKLERQGKVVTVSGGVKAAEKLSTQLSYKVKESLNEEGQRKIALLAAARIPDQSCIFLDSGLTTLAIAREIKGRDDLTIITNDFIIMFYLKMEKVNSFIREVRSVLYLVVVLGKERHKVFEII